MAKRTLDDITFLTKTAHIVEANALGIEAGTNGYKGGDSSHGSRTYIRISDLGNTDIRFHVEPVSGRPSLIIELGGDCELSTMTKALQFILDTLNEQIEEIWEGRDHDGTEAHPLDGQNKSNTK